MPLVDPVSMSSSTATKGPSAPAAETRAKTAAAAVHPIPVLDTPLAKGISLARPALLLGLLVARFDALVSDPASALWSALPVVAAIQAAYAVLCLPGAGSQLARSAKKPRPGERKKNDMTGPNPISVQKHPLPHPTTLDWKSCLLTAGCLPTRQPCYRWC